MKSNQNKHEIEELKLLYEISNSLNEHLDLKKSLYRVLDILANSMNMVRGTISILNPLRNETEIEVAHGISKSAQDKGKYKPGEGITGQVIQTGKAVAVPRISQEPLFLNKTTSRKSSGHDDLSFICVPVKKGAQVIGTLSVDKPYDESFSLTEGKRLLSVIATMIAKQVINLESIQREKEALSDMNKRLKYELENKYSL